MVVHGPLGGVTKDWVLNLEVVLADGTVMETGANNLKNSTGYNLTQLMVVARAHSELSRVYPVVATRDIKALMLVPFSSA